VTAVVDPTCAGADAGEILDGSHRGIPIVESIDAALATADGVTHAVVGMATHGGRFSYEVRELILEAVERGLSIVNGLHDYASDDPRIAEAARRNNVTLTDIRRPKRKSELHFWTGEIYAVNTPRLAVLGTDCALGKRTTTRFLLNALNAAGIRTQMIYTGQTGWMQGADYGFVLDSVVNDYVCGELEHAIVTCDRETNPDLIVIEGQSSLRNPSGPCGAELLVSAGARGVILQHAAGREFFEGYEKLEARIPSLADEIALIGLYGSRVLAVTLHSRDTSAEAVTKIQRSLHASLGLPVTRPLEEGVEGLIPIIERYIEEEHQTAAAPA
jgi:uncharacterized NAD-dependent epimerase/dehydratase family protein